MRSLIGKSEECKQGKNDEHRTGVGETHDEGLHEIRQGNGRLCILLDFPERVGKRHGNTQHRNNQSSDYQDDVLMSEYEFLHYSEGKDRRNRIDRIDHARSKTGDEPGFMTSAQ